MKVTKEKLIELFKKASRPMTRAQIEKEMKVESSGDRISISRLLDQMEEEYYIVRKNDNTFVSVENSGYIIGKLSINRKGTGYIDQTDGSSIIVESQDQGDALDGDTVVVKVSPFDGTGTVLAVRSHAIHQLTGTYTETNTGLKVVPDNEKIAARRYTVRVPKSLKAVPGLKVLLTIEKYGKTLGLAVEKVIGHKDDPGVDILSVLYDHDIDPEFPEDVLAQANAFAAEVTDSEKEGREDLTSVPTITIDGDDSKDFDDAVSVSANENGWNLKVSIADVSHYVTEDSPLDKEALKRGTSTYICNTVVPMLPHVLSNGICSLNPRAARLTITCDMNIGRHGKVKDYRVYPSVICSNERMTYHNVNMILDGDAELRRDYEHLGTMLFDLVDCADAIRFERHRKGAIDFDTTESEIICNDKGYPIDIKARERGHAERAIEDCMIAANVCVADFMKKHSIPALYRVHGEPETKKLRAFQTTSALLGHRFNMPADGPAPKDIQKYLESVKEEDSYFILANLLLRCMQKAVYDDTCIGHYGIAEKEYLHFTSPIRRYPDLIVHRMLRRYAFEQCNDANVLVRDTERMKDYAEQTSVRERASVEAERDGEAMKKAEYMQAYLGTKVEGIISSVTSFGFYVELPNTVEGLVSISSLSDDYFHFDPDRYALIGERTGTVYRIGQKVRVVVDGSSKEKGTVDFRVPGNRNERNSNGRSDRKQTERRRGRSGNDSRNRSGRHASVGGKYSSDKKTGYSRAKKVSGTDHRKNFGMSKGQRRQSSSNGTRRGGSTRGRRK